RGEEEQEPGDGHQHADVAVGPPPPRDEPGDGERAADEAEHDLPARDGPRRVEDDGHERAELRRRGSEPQGDPERRAVLARGEAGQDLRALPAHRCRDEMTLDGSGRRELDPHSTLLTGRAATWDRESATSRAGECNRDRTA